MHPELSWKYSVFFKWATSHLPETNLTGVAISSEEEKLTWTCTVLHLFNLRSDYFIPCSNMIILTYCGVVIEGTALQRMVSELFITCAPHNAESLPAIQAASDFFYLWFLHTEIFASISSKDCVPLTHILLLSLLTNVLCGGSSPSQGKFF